MPRIVVIGPPGAGKTTFANNLGIYLGITTVIHLDELFWIEGWKPNPDRGTIVERSIAEEQWVIEGNFLDGIDKLFSRADLVIWLNLSLLICLYRVIKRHYLSTQEEKVVSASRWRDKITYRIIGSIFLYKFSDAYQLNKKLNNKNSPPYIILKNPKMVASFLERAKLGRPLN